jgi:tetratricopeptide (TPR) repeat protein
MHTNPTYQHAIRLHNRASKALAAGDAVRPEKLFQQSLAIKESLFGPSHQEVAVTLANLGYYYKVTGKLLAARRAYEHALSILRSTVGASHPVTWNVLHNIAQLMKAEAKSIEAWARATRKAPVASGASIQAEHTRFKLAVAPSRIHHLGVFASEPIPEGQRVIEYTGKRIANSCSRRPANKPVYLCKLDRYWSIDGSVNGSGAQFINHCCEPNCRFHREDGRIWIVSLRAISTGEELFLDYNFPKDGLLAPCFCGAPSCRGTINRL